MSAGYNHIVASYKRALLALVLASCFFLHGEAQTTADQVKAVFLFHFTQFVDWPERAMPAENAPFIIGIVGVDPFGNYLDATVEGEKIGTHPIIVRRYKSVKDAGNCQILFIGGNFTEALSELGTKSILTVSDQERFIRSGGMIRFFSENNKVRLRINLKAARAAGLNISSKLLRVAEVVE